MAQNDSDDLFAEETKPGDLQENKKFTVSKYVNNIDTINWLKKRAAKIAQIQYLNNASDLEKHQAIVRVYEKFDDNHDNNLEVKELREMFKENNIDITSKQLLRLFSIVDKDKSGALDINEFKQFALSEEANKHFRDIINELRYKDIYKHVEKRAKFLPFNFSTLLNFLSDEVRKDNLRKQIEGEDIEIEGKKINFSISEVKYNLRRFMQLFKLAYTEVMSSNENISRQIKTSLEYKKEELEWQREKAN
jgi:hypothetical protein